MNPLTLAFIAARRITTSRYTSSCDSSVYILPFWSFLCTDLSPVFPALVVSLLSTVLRGDCAVNMRRVARCLNPLATVLTNDVRVGILFYRSARPAGHDTQSQPFGPIRD